MNYTDEDDSFTGRFEKMFGDWQKLPKHQRQTITVALALIENAVDQRTLPDQDAVDLVLHRLEQDKLPEFDWLTDQIWTLIE